MRNILLQISKWFSKYKFQIWFVLGLRIGYSAWLAIVWIVIDKSIPLSEGVFWETYYNLSRSTTLLGRAFIDVWLRWDAVHYMNIANFGYKGVGVADTVFFPLYPYLVGFISKITTVNVTLIGIIVSSIATLFASIFLYELVIELFGDPKLAKWSTIALLLYPTAFFLHAPYTDASFLALSIGSILMMVKKKPIISGGLACLAGLTRAQGILLMVPLMVYYFQYHWKEKSFLSWKEALSLCISPLGFGLFSLWRIQSGMSGFVSSYETYSFTRFEFPFFNIFLAIKKIIEKPSVLELSEFISAVLFFVLLIWILLTKTFHKKTPLLLYSFAIWFLITSKTVINASPLQSANRYVLQIFFVFIGLSSLILKRTPPKRMIILYVCLTSNLLLISMYALWFFIG